MSVSVYVFQLWDVRSKIVVVVVVGASLCIRLCRCWSLDIIWRHIILCYLALVLAFECVRVRARVCPFSMVQACVRVLLLLRTFYLTVSFTPITQSVHKSIRFMCKKNILPFDIRILGSIHISHTHSPFYVQQILLFKLRSFSSHSSPNLLRPEARILECQREQNFL